jgi:excinuclease ABC subunit C
MMREVLHRYYSNPPLIPPLVRGDTGGLKRGGKGESAADLVIIDGGRGQLNVALEVFKELNIDLNVIGIAKARAEGESERIFLLNKDEPIELEPSSPVTLLLQRIRDEAHRFAIIYHRKLMNKRMFVSALDDIKGIGPIKKKQLLKAFESAAEAVKRYS